MAGWKRKIVNGLPVHQANTISWLPNVQQGFTTRHCGVSNGLLESLNMSVNVGDDPNKVAENRRIAMQALCPESKYYVTAEQVHGGHVSVVNDDGPTLIPDSDGLITNVPGIALMMVFADCVPVFFADPVGRTIGIAHSGWRGTLVDIAGRTVRAMKREYGTEMGSLYAAIGPSISAEKYKVGLEVLDALSKTWPQVSAFERANEFEEQWYANLRLIVFYQLITAGVRPEHIAVSDECTFKNKKDFFSHRREGSVDNPTGRMAGLIAMKSP